MTKGLFLIAAGFSTLTAFAASVKTNETASCLSKAMSVSMVKPKTIENAGRAPFRVTQEYDEDGKTNLQNFVSYFKVTLSRSHAYTIWLEDVSCACTNADQRVSHAQGYDLEIDPIEATEAQWEAGIFEPGATFNEVSGAWGRMSVMTADEWMYDPEDPEFSDPESWTYYIRIDGPCESFCGTLRYAEGIWTPIGIEENPLVIAPKEKPEEGLWIGEYKFVTNEFKFCCVADLAYGRRYAFALKGGEADNCYTLGLDGGKVTTNFNWRVDNSDSLYFNPYSTANYKIWALESSSNYPVALFNLRYRLLPARKITDHTVQGELIVGKSETCTPGRVNNTTNEFYDLIVDDCLYKVTLEKGRKYVIDTDDAKTNLILYVYDSKGNILYENEEDGSGTGNVRCGFKASYKGDYYVGLVEKLADDDVDVPTGNPVQLRVDLADGRDGDPDRWDAADDTYEGATVLQPVLGTEPEEDTKGSEGWHKLGRTDWSDVFALGGRKNCAYRLWVEPEDPAKVFVPVKARVFTMSGKSSSSMKIYGDINRTSTNSLKFVATKDAIYYVELTSSGGNGIDYPDYRVHTVVYDAATGDEGDLGLLKVRIHGAKEGQWSLNSETAKYWDGMVLPLAPKDNYTVKFASVKNFTTPEALKNIRVARGKLTEDVVDVAGWYIDTKDYKDDYPSGRGVNPDGKSVTYGATTLSYSNKVKSEDHTFWRDDVADTFSIAGKDGYYYDIWLTNQVSVIDDEPDAVFSITNAELGVVTQNVTEVRQLPLPTTKAKYVLTVSHANPKHYTGGYTFGNNTSYTLSGFYANVGQIRFSAAEYKVNDNAAEAKLTINRTAKDGKVRVNLWTEDGEFATGIKPNSKAEDNPKIKFYHNQQTLEWANGDNKAKTVIIKLLPDKYPTFHDIVRFFKVRMEDAFDGSADCYHASFAIDSKTQKLLSETQVTFQESATKTPGTIRVDDRQQDIKKPVFDVRAGGLLNFDLARVDGDDGAITVKVDTSALTGGKGTFEEVSWADGDVASKQVSIKVPPATDAKTSKKVTLKLSATSKDKPKFAASSITVNIYNDKFAATLADYAKALSKTCGYTIKEGKSGTWIVNDNGDFVSTNTPSALTFTITGPALFSCKLDGVETNVAVTVVGKTQTFVVSAGVKEVTDVKYEFNFGNYETVFQAVQYGYGKPIFEDGAEVKAKVAAGKLPDGIKLEQDKVTKAWYVRGVPTKAGFYYAEIQDTAVKPAETFTNLAFEVVALRSAIGTFNGLATNAVAIANGASTNSLQSLAQVQMTATVAGKLSAKVAVGGKSYSLTATGFEQVATNDDNVVMLTARLTKVEKKTVKVNGQSQSRTYTNELVLVVRDFDEADTNGWRSCADVALTMACLPDLKGSGFLEDVTYSGRAYRDNSKLAAWVTEASQYAGYYTIALAPADDPFDGAQQGNGYLTLTLDAKGKVKIAGALANGTAYSASSVVGNLCTVEGDCAVSVPLYSFKSPTLLGGWLTLRFKEAYDIGSAVAVLDGADGISWISQDSAATWDGTGFELGLVPVGGYYDTVASLQRYYLNNRFEIEFPADDDLKLLQDILVKNYGAGYDFVAKANPNGMAVDVVGDTVSVAKQVLVKEVDLQGKKTSFNDWTLCTNAANVKVTFKRATGILTGTCDLWYEGMNGTKRVQNAIKNCKHAGVLLMSWDADNLPDSFDEDTWTAGAVVIPQSWKEMGVLRKWNASFPFNILAERFEK